MRRVTFVLVAAVATTTAAPLAAGTALARTPLAAHDIPSFARRYGVSCTLCHAPAPRLTAFGEAFAANGFEVVPGEPARDTVDTGDALLRLMRGIQLSIRIDAYMQALRNPPGELARSDLQAPYGIKLFSGGPIAHKVSYYLYFFLSERGEVAGLEDAYVQFTDIAGSGASLLIGQFQVSDPLFKRELRLEYEDYQPYRVRVGEARADLTYDRGVMAVWSPADGLDLSLQLLNGRGLAPAGLTRQYDRDDGKALAAHAAYALGPARVGLFGYAGTERSEAVDDRIRVWGPDVTLDMGPVELNANFLRRTDSHPFFAAPGPSDTRVDALFAEAVWSPQGPAGRWFFTALYNRVAADAPVFTVRQGESSHLRRYESAALGASWLLQRNLRLTGEVQQDLERRASRLTGGFVLAF